MRIRVVYYGQIRQITGKEDEFIELPAGAPAYNIILKVVEQYGDEIGWLLLTKQGIPRRSVIFAVNDVAIDPGLADALEDEDILSILPAVSGG